MRSNQGSNATNVITIITASRVTHTARTQHDRPLSLVAVLRSLKNAMMPRARISQPLSRWGYSISFACVRVAKVRMVVEMHPGRERISICASEVGTEGDGAQAEGKDKRTLRSARNRREHTVGLTCTWQVGHRPTHRAIKHARLLSSLFARSPSTPHAITYITPNTRSHYNMTSVVSIEPHRAACPAGAREGLREAVALEKGTER
ncbi:hypothetical protein BJ912DRAFT_1048973 [Pholiota molesta]|nr:hypothetical protein BJ912DRAFT_1048973 [Pholiota molesta]